MNDEELLARLPEEARAANGVPDDETAWLRARAADAVEEALGDLLYPGGVRTSPLGPGWSSDVDVHVREEPDPGRLERLGWLPLDELLTALGSPGRGRWAVVDKGEVLGLADVQVTLPADPVRSIIGRCRRRGEVRLREVLELRDLVRRGIPLPQRHAVLSAAADAEASLGDDVLARWGTGRHRFPPVSLFGTGPRRAAKRLLRRRGPSVGVALSGVDGSGKSTVARLILRDLTRLGVPATLVWTRPGMRISWLEPLAMSAKRILREDVDPGVLRVAADPDRTLRSRRGPLGWIWTALVTISFVRDVRRRARRTSGVIVYDRHLLDALVTLEFAYRGVRLNVHRGWVRRRMPAAAATSYLAATADLAVARKPGDAIGRAAVAKQLQAYVVELANMPGVAVLDAARPAEELARAVLKGLLGVRRIAPVRGEASAAHRRR